MYNLWAQRYAAPLQIWWISSFALQKKKDWARAFYERKMREKEEKKADKVNKRTICGAFCIAMSQTVWKASHILAVHPINILRSYNSNETLEDIKWILPSNQFMSVPVMQLQQLTRNRCSLEISDKLIADLHKRLQTGSSSPTTPFISHRHHGEKTGHTGKFSVCKMFKTFLLFIHLFFTVFVPMSYL